MRAAEARELGQSVVQSMVLSGSRQAYALLLPRLTQPTAFASLDQIGTVVGRAPLDAVNELLQLLAADRTMGGWVVIGSALGQQLNRDLLGALDRCRNLIILGATWYVTDILGERVPGPGLVAAFARTLESLDSWAVDANPWVRRAVGVAAHYWAKRSRGAVSEFGHAQALLMFMEKLFSERSWDALKGIGWGLKTIGRYYPELMTDWLVEQVVVQQRRHRAMMVKKALTYLSPSQRARVVENAGHER